MGNLQDKMAAGFVVTSELVPPKGTDIQSLLDTASMLKGYVDAFNITDSHSARMRLAPVAAAHMLIDHGVEPILQMVTRDRNRIAIQSDMLGADVLGITNLVCMGGDPPHIGDHPDAKPVYDLSSDEVISVANALNNGSDYAGNKLNQSTNLHIGAVVNPGASDLDTEIAKMEKKANAGARFFQTQAVYDVEAFQNFMSAIAHLDVTVIAGIMPIKSVKMAEYANEKIPGICIPQSMIQEIADADDVAECSIRIASDLITALQPVCGGVHIMALGAEDRIPRILDRVRA